MLPCQIIFSAASGAEPGKEARNQLDVLLQGVYITKAGPREAGGAGHRLPVCLWTDGPAVWALTLLLLRLGACSLSLEITPYPSCLHLCLVSSFSGCSYHITSSQCLGNFQGPPDTQGVCRENSGGSMNLEEENLHHSHLPYF